MSAVPALEWRIATRYLRARTDNRFLSFSTVVGALGIVVGVTDMIVVLAVMNGFEVELEERILAVTAHATLTGLEGPLAEWQSLMADAAAAPHVLAVAPYVEERGMIAQGKRVSGALVRGIVPADERRIGNLAAHLKGGTLESLAPGSYAVLLGKAHWPRNCTSRPATASCWPRRAARRRRAASCRACAASRSRA